MNFAINGYKSIKKETKKRLTVLFAQYADVTIPNRDLMFGCLHSRKVTERRPLKGLISGAELRNAVEVIFVS